MSRTKASKQKRSDMEPRERAIVRPFWKLGSCLRAPALPLSANALEAQYCWAGGTRAHPPNKRPPNPLPLAIAHACFGGANVSLGALPHPNPAYD